MKIQTPQDYKTFLDSIKSENEGPAEKAGELEQTIIWNAKQDLLRICPKGKKVPDFTCQDADDMALHVNNLLELIAVMSSRAEANTKPADLAEQVKACVRAGMDAVCPYRGKKDVIAERNFRKLSEAE